MKQALHVAGCVTIELSFCLPPSPQLIILSMSSQDGHVSVQGFCWGLDYICLERRSIRKNFCVKPALLADPLHYMSPQLLAGYMLGSFWAFIGSVVCYLDARSTWYVHSVSPLCPCGEAHKPPMHCPLSKPRNIQVGVHGL